MLNKVIEQEVDRFKKIWNEAIQVNGKEKYTVFKCLFLSTVDPKIADEVELRLDEEYE